VPEIEACSFAARIDCRYLVQRPDEAGSPVQGYGMDAETMLRLVSTWFPGNTIISMQAPHPFYRDVHTREVGYSWATHAQSEESVRLHHEMLLHVLAATGDRPERRLLVGFSQPVGLNYRFAATYPGAVRGVIGVCGGMPKDWETGARYGQVDAALLHIARSEDEIYPAALTRQYPARLGIRAQDAEFLELPGGHRFPSLAQPAVQDWVKRKFGG
jgi:predicted esterase